MMRYLLSLFLLGFILCVSWNTRAESSGVLEESEEDLLNRYRYRIENTLTEIHGAIQPSCDACEIFSASSDSEKYSPQCRKRYRDFYHIKDRLSLERPEDQSIEIRLAVGYMDYLTSVDDQYVAAAFATSLRRKCTDGKSACGFVQDPDDADLLTKEIRIMGPDGKPRRRFVKLHLRSSSYTNSERLNRGAYLEEQSEKTAETKRFFEEGLVQADMVLYVGHARGGGGPDFAPPMVNPKTRRTDYNWHRANPRGLNGMLQVLKSTKTPAKIVGIFACDANDHFGSHLKKAVPNTALVLSGANEFEASVAQATAAIDSVLGLKCAPEFKNAVNAIKHVHDYPVAPVNVDF